MKYQLKIKLVDCVPSVVTMKMNRDSNTDVIDHAKLLFEENVTMKYINIHDESGQIIFIVDELSKEMGEYSPENAADTLKLTGKPLTPALCEIHYQAEHDE